MKKILLLAAALAPFLVSGCETILPWEDNYRYHTNPWSKQASHMETSYDARRRMTVSDGMQGRGW